MKLSFSIWSLGQFLGQSQYLQNDFFFLWKPLIRIGEYFPFVVNFLSHKDILKTKHPKTSFSYWFILCYFVLASFLPEALVASLSNIWMGHFIRELHIFFYFIVFLSLSSTLYNFFQIFCITKSVMWWAPFLGKNGDMKILNPSFQLAEGRTNRILHGFWETHTPLTCISR